MDTIKVYNPTDQDYVVVWDSFRHVIKAKSQQSFPRYIAWKYAREMVDRLINTSSMALAEAAIGRENAKRAQPLDPYERQAFIDKFPKTNDEEARKKWYDIVWLGVEQEYGLDVPEETAPQAVDQRTVDEKILAGLDKRYVEPSQAPETPPSPVQSVTATGIDPDREAKREEMLKSVSKRTK